MGFPRPAVAQRDHILPPRDIAAARQLQNRHRQLGAGLGGAGRDGSVAGMTPAAKSLYGGSRFPGEVISHAVWLYVWLYFRFPLSLRMVEEMLAARGIVVSHETVRQWGRKFGQAFQPDRRRLPGAGDKWHLDDVC